MNWIVENWSLVLIAVLVIAGLINLVLNDKKKAKEWLLMAVTEAEKALGEKTGALKLRCVYDLFLQRFPVFSKFISFEEFSGMVDEALVEMKHLIETNIEVRNHVMGVE